MAVKKNKSFFMVNMGMFEYDIFVSIGQTKEEIYKSLKSLPENEVSEKGRNFLIEGFKHNIENPPNGSDAYCIIIETGDTLLVLEKYPKDCDDYGTLIHEVFHSVSTPFMKKGLKLCNKSEEAYAYAIGHVTTKIFAKLWAKESV